MSTLDTIKKIGEDTNNINEKTNTLVVEVALEKLETNPLNFYDEEFNLEDLKLSIENFGQIEPLLITNKYRIISGHRRFKALTALNKPHALCIIKNDIDYLDEELLLISANKQRIKTKAERNQEIKRLDELYQEKKQVDPNFKINRNKQIAEDLGISERTVARVKNEDDMNGEKDEFEKSDEQKLEDKYEKCKKQLVNAIDKFLKCDSEADDYVLNKLIEVKKSID